MKEMTCACGNDTWKLAFWMTGSQPLVAACAECGRVTSSVEDGVQYRGMNVDDIEPQ